MSFSKLLTAGVLVASLVGGAAQASEASASAAFYTARYDYSYPYHGYNGYDYPGVASANYGGHYAPNAVASADPTQNGFAGEGYGANSGGGGNRAPADYGGQYVPNAVASADPTQNGFAGEGYGANSAGGGNRA